jgi:hypothetical protein
MKTLHSKQKLRDFEKRTQLQINAIMALILAAASFSFGTMI